MCTVISFVCIILTTESETKLDLAG